MNEAIALHMCLRDALAGVGDAALGEWNARERCSLHLKRCLTDEEWGDRPWGMDYRKTPEGERRLHLIGATLPAEWAARIMAEVR